MRPSQRLEVKRVIRALDKCSKIIQEVKEKEGDYLLKRHKETKDEDYLFLVTGVANEYQRVLDLLDMAQVILGVLTNGYVDIKGDIENA